MYWKSASLRRNPKKLRRVMEAARMSMNETRKESLLAGIQKVLDEARDYDRVGVLPGRQLSLTITKLEEALMWAEKVPTR